MTLTNEEKVEITLGSEKPGAIHLFRTCNFIGPGRV